MGVCAAISGTFEELVMAAEVGVRAESAVFPVLPATQWLSDFERDRLWHLFHVPVYAVQVDGEGGIEAFECEAQEGMHLAKGVERGQDMGLCNCGRTGARLMTGPSGQAAD
jgi:hypothetical protein